MKLAEAWRMECQDGWHGLAQRASALRHTWEGRKRAETIRCSEQARILSSVARQGLRSEAQRLAQDHIGLLRGPEKIVRLERLRFANRTQALEHAWQGLRDNSGHALREKALRLRDKAERRMEGEGERLRQARRLAASGWRQGLRAGREALSLKDKLVHAADPARLLALGFSLLRTRDGRPVRGVADVAEGEVVINQLKDGTVESRVIGKEETQ
jgi:exonuclease VII large subunit